jgi:hypothetical protein
MTGKQGKGMSFFQLLTSGCDFIKEVNSTRPRVISFMLSAFYFASSRNTARHKP